MSLTLVILAAGLGTRYGGDKQLEALGPGGETLFDYGIFDALRAGFTRIAIVARRELELVLRDHVASIFGSSLDLEIAIQQLSQLPAGYSLPAGRTKPWGTGHAVLAAESVVDGPFVVMNADDFYGASAFQALAEHLRGAVGNDFAAVGYTVNETLSPHGGVSRAICEVDDDGYLVSVTEVKRIQREGAGLTGFTVSGDTVSVPEDSTVSMNLWAATRSAFPLLNAQFARFLEDSGDDSEAEFYLSEAVSEQIVSGSVRVKVIPTAGPWLGVTYQEDKEYVLKKLNEQVAAGDYPEKLFNPIES
jgi:NDP-sugar pyrophosphorylase family protein